MLEERTRRLPPRPIRLPRRPLPTPLKMPPNPLPQRQQLLRAADAETRVPRARRLHGLVPRESDVHLLAGVGDVEPGELVLAVGRDGAGSQAEGLAVEGVGEVEGGGGDEEVDVGEGEDHCFFFFCVLLVGLVFGGLGWGQRVVLLVGIFFFEMWMG